MSATETPQLKTGLLSTEFYLTVATSITGVLVLLGYLTPELADQFVEAIVSVIGGLLTIVSTITYIHGRITLKRESMQNSRPLVTLPESLDPATPSESPAVYPK